MVKLLQRRLCRLLMVSGVVLSGLVMLQNVGVAGTDTLAAGGDTLAEGGETLAAGTVALAGFAPENRADNGAPVVALTARLADGETAGAAPPPAVDFAACLAGLQDRAVAAGVTPSVASQVAERVERLDRVIELDRRQPEFTTAFRDYLGQRVTPERVARGQALLRTHAALLERIQRETGVPSNYLLAFWGLETDFGGYLGRTFIPSALATLACDPRRADYFANEWVALLHLVQRGDAALGQLHGSWAGAMGQVQFMPSVFLRYAVDADGDGRRDLWGSVPDALMSAGHYLQQLGWDSSYRWGREVLLPKDFAWAALAESPRKSLRDWRQLGLRDTSGHLVAELDLPATLLLPAGHRGPAFLVYPNFDIIMQWNRSEYFALTVGHFADRIAGGGALATRIPADLPRFSRAQVEQLQRGLNQAGFDSGEVDGILGPATRAAVRHFQLAHGLVADGLPDQALIQRFSRAE